MVTFFRKRILVPVQGGRSFEMGGLGEETIEYKVRHEFRKHEQPNELSQAHFKLEKFQYVVLFYFILY